KSKRNGLSGCTLMPLRTGGLKAGLRPTRTPGLGKNISCAPAGKGPKMLIKKAAIMRADKWVFIVHIKNILYFKENKLMEKILLITGNTYPYYSHIVTALKNK